MIALFFGLLACAAANSCAAYAEAATACAEAAGAESGVYDAASLCGAGEWAPALEAEYGDLYACRAAAYEASACSTADEVDRAASAAADCAGR